MSNNNMDKIYEIAQKLSSPDNLREDLNEIVSLGINYLSSKYLTPITAAVASHKEYCASHPCREVNLLNAFKPFTQNAESIDRLIEAVNTLRILSPWQKSTAVYAASVRDSSVHPDGVYDIDEGCIKASSGADSDFQSYIGEINIEPVQMVLLLLLLAK